MATERTDRRAVSTIARVDLSGAGDAKRGDGALRSVLDRLQQTIRPGDRVCPVGVSRIAISFGPDAEALSPRTLGERLADALSSPATTVTVERGGSPAPPATDEQGPAPVTSTVVPMPMRRHRTIVRCSPLGSPGPVDNGGPTSRTVLVVEPRPTAAGGPGLVTTAARRMAAELGFKTAVHTMSTDDAPALDVDGSPVDLTILVVPGHSAGDSSRWKTSSWCLPALIAGAYVAAGVEVLAVSAGAGAGALAGCASEGATVLLDPDDLPAALESLCRDEALTSSGSASECVEQTRSLLDALMQLTACERRVLFYLTQGRPAQDIADELVVSLTTVRSHIRSILRKLGVRSQLAAVALANRGVHSWPGAGERDQGAGSGSS